VLSWLPGALRITLRPQGALDCGSLLPLCPGSL